MAAFGGFTSIVTNNCTSLPKIGGLSYTSGNALTAGFAFESVVREAARRHGDLGRLKGAVIGAAGNIGRAVSALLAEKVGSLTLIGSNRGGSEQRLESAAQAVYREILADLVELEGYDANPIAGRLLGLAPIRGFVRSLKERKSKVVPSDGRHVRKMVIDAFGKDPFVSVSTSMESVLECDVVLCAANQAAPFIGPGIFKPGAIVCDVGVPQNLEPSVYGRRDIHAFEGGLGRLPLGQAVDGITLDLEDGSAFGCMSETLIMGLTRYGSHFSYGDIGSRQVRQILSLARLHGFSPLERIPEAVGGRP